MALFGEKYGEKVRVVSMGDFSKRTLRWYSCARIPAQIMLFKIVSEAGVAAGVRRIEALTGDGVIEYYRKQEEDADRRLPKLLKTNQPAEL